MGRLILVALEKMADINALVTGVNTTLEHIQEKSRKVALNEDGERDIRTVDQTLDEIQEHIKALDTLVKRLDDEL